jgi:hypothetical protein
LSAWATQKSGIHHKRKEMGRWFCRSITGLTAANGDELFSLNLDRMREPYVFDTGIERENIVVGEK